VDTNRETAETVGRHTFCPQRLGHIVLRRILLLSALIAVAWPGACATSATRHVEKMAAMPDYFQAEKAYGELPRGGAAYCGPTAAANALIWLDTNGFGSLHPAAAPDARDEFELIRALGTPKFMSTDPVTGTGPTGVMRGIERYGAECGYRAAVEYAGWRTGLNRVSERPAIEWMRRGVAGTSNLLLNIGWYANEKEGAVRTRIGGHWITAVACETQGNETWLIIHDPAKRSQTPRRDSLKRCPVKCLLKPLAAGTTLRKKKDGDTFAGDGLFVLDGIPLKKGADLAILDGAVGFTLSPK